MHKFIYSNKDSWISDISSSQNYGGDEILELHKAYNNDTLNGVTRVLVQFNLTEISKSINLGTTGTDSKYFLRMYSTEASELPANYEVSAFALSQSWEEGTGKLDTNPILQDGVTWENYDHRTAGNLWKLPDLGEGASGSSSDRLAVAGGGVWYTGSGFESSQSFSYESPDINMDITDIVHKWITGSYSAGNTFPDGIPNNGMILKYSGSYESSSVYRGDLKFFSSNTHTIYPPKIEVKWNDVAVSSTGSLSALDLTGTVDNHVYVKGIKPSYKENEVVKFRVGSRKKYIGKTFSTSVETHTGSYISTGSAFYSIVDLHTGETMIPFGSYTSMSIDSNSNYFKQDLNTFQPNRLYKILVKLKYDDGQEIIYDDDNTFKVVR